MQSLREPAAKRDLWKRKVEQVRGGGKGDEHVVAGVLLGRLAPAILDALAWMLSLLLSRAGVRCLAC